MSEKTRFSRKENVFIFILFYSYHRYIIYIPAVSDGGLWRSMVFRQQLPISDFAKLAVKMLSNIYNVKLAIIPIVHL